MKRYSSETQTKVISMDKFESLQDLYDYANVETLDDQSSRTDDTVFTETKSFAEAFNLAVGGWDAVRPEVDALLETVSESFKERFAQVSTVRIGMQGSAVHMGRFVAGRPDCMIGHRRLPSTRHGKVVKVVVDYGANAGTPAKDMLARGVVLTVLIDALSSMGLSTEIWGETSVTMGKTGLGLANKTRVHTTLVKMHDATEPLDINNMMFAMANPSMLRRMTFAVRELCEFGLNACRSASHGQSIPITQADDIEADVVANRVEHGGNNRDMVSDPAGWVLQTIRGLGLID